MTTSQLDDAFDAYLAGRPVPAEAAPLVAFADSVREMSARPGRPSAGLAELLATGLLIGSADGSTEPAPTVRGAVTTALPGRPKRRFRMFTVLAAAVAKFASAGAVAHATAGVGVAIVTVSSAGAAGVLPAPLQNGVATTIEAVTPFTISTAEEPVQEPVVEPVVEETPTEELPTEEAPTDAPTEDTPTEDTPTEDPATAEEPAPANFGATVREDARDGGVDGRQISQQARQAHQPEHARGPAAKAERPAPKGTAPAAEQPEAADEDPATAPAEAPAEAPAGQPQDGAGRR